MALLRRRPVPANQSELEPQALAGETMADVFQHEFVDRNSGELAALYNHGVAVDGHLHNFYTEFSEPPHYFYMETPNGLIDKPIVEIPVSQDRRDMRQYLKLVNDDGPLIAVWSIQMAADEMVRNPKSMIKRSGWRELNQFTSAIHQSISVSAPQRPALTRLQADVRSDALDQANHRSNLEGNLDSLITANPKLLVGIVDWLERQPETVPDAHSPVTEGLIDLLAGSYSNGNEHPGIIKRTLAELKTDARPFFTDRDLIGELLEQVDAKDSNISSWLRTFEKLASREDIAHLLLTEPIESLPADIQDYIKAAGHQLADEVDTALAAHLKPYYAAHKYRYPPTVEQLRQIIGQLSAAANILSLMNSGEVITKKVAKAAGRIILPAGIEGAQRSLQKQMEKISSREQVVEKPLLMLKRTGARTFEFTDADEETLTETIADSLAKYHDKDAEKDIRKLLQAICLEPSRATKYGNREINVGGKKYTIYGAKVGDYPNVPTSSQLSRDLRVLFINNRDAIYLVMAHHKDDQKEITRAF